MAEEDPCPSALVPLTPRPVGVITLPSPPPLSALVVLSAQDGSLHLCLLERVAASPSRMEGDGASSWEPSVMLPFLDCTPYMAPILCPPHPGSCYPSVLGEGKFARTHLWVLGIAQPKWGRVIVPGRGARGSPTKRLPEHSPPLPPQRCRAPWMRATSWRSWLQRQASPSRG